MLTSFEPNSTAVVIGGSGGLGKAFVERLSESPSIAHIYSFSRTRSHTSLPSETRKVTTDFIDLCDEASIQNAAAQAGHPSLIIIATGLLHKEGRMPEKSIRHLDMGWLETVMRVNAFGPILAAKHFLPLMPRTRKTVFAALSARVGSITDNHLGGWHGYRASKAALNMFLKTAAIEYARSHKQASVIGLHPGTVATPLSRPYQKGIPEDKLFTPDYATRKLLDVIENVTPKETGQIFAWDGSVIPA